MKRILSLLLISIFVCGSFSSFGIAQSRKYFGTYMNHKYYYTLSNEKTTRYEKDGKKPSSSTLKKWVKGSIDVAMVFASWKYALPYSVLCATFNLSNNVKVRKGSYFSYTLQIKPTTRKIWTAKKGGKVVYEDQKGVYDGFYTFNPVGTGFKKAHYDKKYASKKRVKTKFYGNKKYILRRCHIMRCHKAKEVWSLDVKVFNEAWK